ncbi:hypothetical protein JB92DRAFT_336564 [Gautieria morchelliformis]|nr:hypothetical protein JB92DRAFT_336564 [Gautieria morchelliformis]
MLIRCILPYAAAPRPGRRRQRQTRPAGGVRGVTWVCVRVRAYPMHFISRLYCRVPGSHATLGGASRAYGGRPISMVWKATAPPEPSCRFPRTHGKPRPYIATRVPGHHPILCPSLIAGHTSTLKPRIQTRIQESHASRLARRLSRPETEQKAEGPRGRPGARQSQCQCLAAVGAGVYSKPRRSIGQVLLSRRGWRTRRGPGTLRPGRLAALILWGMA